METSINTYGFVIATAWVGLIGLTIVVTVAIRTLRAAYRQARKLARRWFEGRVRRMLKQAKGVLDSRRYTMSKQLTWSQVEARIARARQALDGGRVTIRSVDVPTARAAGATATYAVRNGENAGGDPYIVAFYERTPTGVCSCPDFQATQGPACKHTAMVVLAEWPNSLGRWKARVRTLCASAPERAPAPQPEPQIAPPAADVETMIRQVVHERLSAMEAQITATIAQAFQGNLTPAQE